MHTARVDIEFDPAKAIANLRKHRVSFADAEQALRDPQAITIEDPDADGEQRFVTLGADTLGACWSWSIRRAATGSGSSRLEKPARAK
jgi:uncharacterized protein